MNIRISRRQVIAPKDSYLSKLSLPELQRQLKDKGDIGPQYLFNAVKEGANIHDYRYVFWLDLMGAGSAMKLSLPRAARSIMKIHAAALLAKKRHDQFEVNPVMDGIYGFAKSRETLEAVLTDILTSLAHVFVHERLPQNRFMVRAGVSFGPLMTGRALAAGAPILKKNKAYLGGTAIGMAISQAYGAESDAPPMGVFIHESARAFAPQDSESHPFITNLWKWLAEDDPLWWAIRLTLVEHFSWLKRNPVGSLYKEDSLLRHKALAGEYFRLYELPNFSDKG